MTLHISINDVIERCKGTTSKLAIFKCKKGDYKYNVLFANTVQTQHDIKNNPDFICLFDVDQSLDDLEKTLNNYSARLT